MNITLKLLFNVYCILLVFCCVHFFLEVLIRMLRTRVFKVCIDAFVFVLHTCKLVCLSRVFNKLLTYLLTYLLDI